MENSVRAAAAFLPARPITNPAWYHRRAAFYVFLPTLEVLVVVLYAAARVDQRFFVHGKAERLQREAEEEEGRNAKEKEGEGEEGGVKGEEEEEGGVKEEEDDGSSRSS